MDGDRFDALTRSLGSGRSRRGVLKGLGAAALGAVGLSRVGKTSAANGGNSDCAHFCVTAFPPGAARGQCVSDAAQGTGTCVACGGDINRFCDGVCVDLTTTANCGSCGAVCTTDVVGATPTCENGACTYECPDGQSTCNGACVDLTSNANNCGTCGTVCPSGSVCTEGACTCVLTTCAAQGKTCGTISDGCSGTLDCGTCADGQCCGSDNTCGTPCGDTGACCTGHQACNASIGQCCFSQCQVGDGVCCSDCQTWNPAGGNCAGSPQTGCQIVC